MKKKIMKVKLSELRVGDMVDLEGDEYADPNKENDLHSYMYGVVTEIENETPDCTVVYFENSNPVGFPVSHELTIKRKED